jgi:hypothetical protein
VGHGGSSFERDFPPTSAEGRAFFDAARSGDLVSAARIGAERAQHAMPWMSTGPLVHSPGRQYMSVLSGTCLEPIVKDGDWFLITCAPPKSLELAVFRLRDEPESFGRLKVFLQTVERGNLEIPQFGTNQPKEIHVLVQTNPLTIFGIADHDVAYLYVCNALLKENEYNKTHKFPFTAEQVHAINAGVGRG